MRVTKQGNLLFGYEGKWTCQRCGCEWEMDKTDPKPKQSSDQRDGDAFYMNCPTCNTVVWRNIPNAGSYYNR